MSIFNINPDIRRRNSRVGILHERKYFEESKEKIFARSWQFLGSKARNKQSQTFYRFRKFSRRAGFIYQTR